MLMREDELRAETTVEEPVDADQKEPQLPSEPAPPITSRFLFVNVAGRRARQLHKGAFLRIPHEELEELALSKVERLAMEEVNRGLVYYDLPDWTPSQHEPVVEQPTRHRAGR